VKPEWVRTIRTAIQVVIAVVALVPVLVPALGLSATVGVGAGLTAIAAVVTRIMAVPQLSELINRLLRSEE